MRKPELLRPQQIPLTMFTDTSLGDSRRRTLALYSPRLPPDITHVLPHFAIDGITRPDLVTRETEAELVTFLVCNKLVISSARVCRTCDSRNSPREG